MDRQYCVYILTNAASSVLYTGVTNDLRTRVHQHRSKAARGFTATYNVDRLVYYETTSDVRSAIQREKQIKGGSRRKKMALIDEFNPSWVDLYESL